MAKTPHSKLPARDSKAKAFNVVVETPRGCRNKYKYDEERGVFRLNSVLPAGSVFPFDFGYIPSTRADDGDPVDVLSLMDEPVFTGCLVPSRLIGVIEAEEIEKGKRERNDRLLAVAIDSHDNANIRTVKDLEKHLVAEIEHFFVSYNETKGKTFKIIGCRGPKQAARLLERARRTSQSA